MKSRRQRGEGKGDTQSQEPGRQATTAEDHTPEKKALTEQKRTTRKVSPHFSSSKKESSSVVHAAQSSEAELSETAARKGDLGGQVT